jgi:hypothetical protein
MDEKSRELFLRDVTVCKTSNGLWSGEFLGELILVGPRDDVLEALFDKVTSRVVHHAHPD